MLAINILYFVSSLLVSVLLEFAVIRFSAKHNLYDSIDERKIHTGKVSRLGGFGFMVPFIVLGLYCFFRFYVKGFCSIHEFSVWGLLLGSTIIYVSGTVDDIKDLNPWVKLWLQILAIVVCYVCYAVAFHDQSYSILKPSLTSIFVLLIAVVFFIGCINSYNLIDGSDLLSSSVSIYPIFTLGFFLKDFNPIFWTLSIILCGGILGFMFFNRPDAKIFMGDGGSQSLGLIIAFMCLMTISQSESRILTHLICMNLVALPCIDCIAAIWRRIRQHVGIFTPDRFHMHHKLLALGCKKWGIFAVVTIVQVVICGLALVSWYWKEECYAGSVILQVVAFLLIVGYFAVLHSRAHKKVDVK